MSFIARVICSVDRTDAIRRRIDLRVAIYLTAAPPIRDKGAIVQPGFDHKPARKLSVRLPALCLCAHVPLSYARTHVPPLMLRASMVEGSFNGRIPKPLNALFQQARMFVRR